MKNIILTLTLFPLILFGQNSKISGDITNPKGEYVYLEFFKPNLEKRIFEKTILDSAKVENGQFELNVQIDSLIGVQFFDGKREYKWMFIAPGDDINMTFNTSYFDETITFSGKGSRVNNMNCRLSLIEEIEINQMNDFDENITIKDTVMLFDDMDSIQVKLAEYVHDLMKEFPEVLNHLQGKVDYYQKAVQGSKSRVRMALEFNQLESEVVGKPFLEVFGVDLKGKESKITDFYGKPLLLDFWATWCGPCKVEIPFLKKIEEDYKGKVDVLSVGVWCKEEAWKDMAKEFGFEHNIFLDREQAQELQDTYLLKFIPRYMLLDKKGNIVSIQSGRPSGDLRNELDTFLNSIN